MSNILPLAIGIILGNDKMRTQVVASLQQLSGQGIDFLNNMNEPQNQGDPDEQSDESN